MTELGKGMGGGSLQSEWVSESLVTLSSMATDDGSSKTETWVCEDARVPLRANQVIGLRLHC